LASRYRSETSIKQAQSTITDEEKQMIDVFDGIDGPTDDAARSDAEAAESVFHGLEMVSNKWFVI